LIIQHLNRHLPIGYAAEPRVHLGAAVEVDVGTYEHDALPHTTFNDPTTDMTFAALPAPTLTVETDLGDPSEYEVLIYDLQRGRRLVAAIEIVSPANKDRPEHRRAFVAKCVALLQRQVCVAIVDVVTVRHFNLYADLLSSVERIDPALTTPPPATYAIVARCRQTGRRSVLDSWYHPLLLNGPLPTLPLWLGENLSIPLDLETSYMDACRLLRIPDAIAYE
jgi:hypothetical protein